MRIPKEIWQRPRYDVLLEQRYKQDEPPFDPFPTISNVINSAFCPVAGLHDFLYGFGNATVSAGEYPVGDLFHRFIANLKSVVRSGEDLLELPDIMLYFEDFARDKDENSVRACELYLEPWLGRKMKELRGTKANDEIFFDITVANARVPFALGDRLRSYPLYGQIDELDFKNKRIVERTIKGDPADDSPPTLKDFQVWLLWKILSSVEKNQYPSPWKSMNFDDFDLVVETPYRDFVVKKYAPDFEKQALEAYGWISDIAKESKAVGEAWRYRSCTFNNKKECGLAWSCYGKARTHPTSRGEMRQRLSIFYRPLLWEQMWEHHLLRYQLTMLTEAVLKKHLKGHISIGKVTNEAAGKITLEIENGIAPALERHIDGENGCTVVFGSFRLGAERPAVVESLDPTKKEITVRLENRGRSPSGQVRVLFPEMSVLSEGPWFLKRTNQQELHKLEKWGFDNPEKARGHSVIRMMECIFGEDVLRMEEEHGQGSS
jgi:hypothetical protein